MPHSSKSSSKPDEEIERSNDMHKSFIDALTRAFEALGGKEWLTKQIDPEEYSQGEEDIEQVVFTNVFSALGLEESKDGEGESEEESDQDTHTTAVPQRQQQRKPKSKGKKGKRGKKAKTKAKKQSASIEEKSLDDVPLESYRIIEDKDGIMTDYLMATYALVLQWIDLRSYIQDIWSEVAYDGLNGAMAGAVSNMATALISTYCWATRPKEASTNIVSNF
jgi:hypothetical protein